MKKNWIKTGMIALMAVVGMTSCETEAQREKQVEAFVGAYEYVTTGEANLYVGGVKATTMPLNEDGSFEIVRSGAGNRVAIIAFNDSIFGTVKGKELTIETTSMTTSYEGVDIELAFLNNKAQLVADSLLQWKSDISVSATYGAYALTGDGEVNLVAIKKK